MANQKNPESVHQSSEDLLNQAVNEVTDKNENAAQNVEQFVQEVSARFIEKKLDEFPALCAETRRVNLIKKKLDADMGNAGGWSKDKTFKFDYEIPRDLYMFMQNLVYRDFWQEDNEKHWRWFMRRILAGDQPEILLMK